MKKTELIFQYPIPKKHEKTAGQINIVYVGETLSNFCQHTPEKIADKLGQTLFISYVSGQRGEAPFIPEKILEKLKAITIEFLLETHPFYCNLKEPEDTDFILRFITGVLAFYRQRIAPKGILDKFTKNLVEEIIDPQYGAVFSDYEQILSNTVDISEESSSPIDDVTKMFTRDCFWGFLNAYRLVETVLKDTELDSGNNESRNQALLSHLMAVYMMSYLEESDSLRIPLLYADKGFQKYKILSNDVSCHYAQLCRKISNSELNERCSFDTLQMAVLKELEYITTGKFKIRRCIHCRRYFIHSGNRHNGFCSEKCRPCYNYWMEQVKKVQDALRHEMSSPTSKENSYTNELRGLFTYKRIDAVIANHCSQSREFDAYFALVLGAYYTRDDIVDIKDKKIDNRKSAYSDRERLVLFLEEKADLFSGDEDLKTFLKYVEGDMPPKYEPPKMWEKAKKYLNTDTYLDIPWTYKFGYIIKKRNRTKASLKTYQAFEGGDNHDLQDRRKNDIQRPRPKVRPVIIRKHNVE